MRAVLCNKFEGVSGLSLGTMADPQPGAGEVLIEVHAAAVSYMDYLMISGGYQMRPPLPYIPGTSASGTVIACGDQVNGVKVGDRVSCEGWFGAFAERMVVNAARIVPLPANTDFVVGSTILHGYLTAWYALAGRAQVKPGETVLVTGAAGGVGLACVELAHQLGARVIAVVGNAAKAAIVREQGADEVIDHSCEDIAQRVKALTGNKGLDICIDNVGGALFGTLARLMGWNGRLLPIGFTSGDIPSLPMNLPLLKNYSILGTFAGAWAERFPEEATRARAEVMALVRDGKLHPRVDRVLPLEHYADAMSAIADRSVMGRIVLLVR